MSISEEKKRIRSIVHQRKAAMTREEIIDSDIKIQENIIKLEEIRSAGTVFCFVSMKDEIDTRPIIKKLLEQGKKVGVPRCIEGNNLRVYNIRSFDDLKKLKISIKKAKFFITCNKDFQRQVPFYRENLKLALTKPEPKKLIQASLFDYSSITGVI